MRNAIAIGIVLALAACKGPGLGPASSQAAPRPAAAYDLGPLLSALRPAEVAGLKRKVGVDDLSELPFYDLDLALDGAGESLAGRYTLHYRNRTGRELAALPFLLHANTPRELGGGTAAPLVVFKEAKALEGPAVTAVERKRLTLVELRFARPVRIGERLKLEVTFSGKLRQLPPGSNDLFGQAFASLGVSGSGAAASACSPRAMASSPSRQPTRWWRPSGAAPSTSRGHPSSATSPGASSATSGCASRSRPATWS